MSIRLFGGVSAIWPCFINGYEARSMCAGSKTRRTVRMEAANNVDELPKSIVLGDLTADYQLKPSNERDLNGKLSEKRVFFSAVAETQKGILEMKNGQFDWSLR